MENLTYQQYKEIKKDLLNTKIWGKNDWELSKELNKLDPHKLPGVYDNLYDDLT